MQSLRAQPPRHGGTLPLDRPSWGASSGRPGAGRAPAASAGGAARGRGGALLPSPAGALRQLPPCQLGEAAGARSPSPLERSAAAQRQQSRRRRRRQDEVAAAGAGALGGVPAGEPDDAAAGGSAAPKQQQQQPTTIWGRIKRFFVGDGLDKERLKALGMGAFASYGFVSNLNYGTALGISWLAFVKAYKVSPLAPGQWKPFLAFYAGMWAVQNLARPLRISVALALAPAFDRAITAIGERLRVDKKVAFGIFLFGMGTVTSTVLFGSLWLLGGFP